MSQGLYSESRKKFEQLLSDFPQFAGPLRDELGFVFDFNTDESADSQRWERERGLVDWRRKVWSVFQGSKEFGTRSIIAKSAKTEDEETPQQLKVIETADATKLKPERKGEALEQATLSLLQELFSFDESTERRILDELHQQHRGAQLGYDIGATICTTATSRGRVRCRFECKAQETKITSDTIGGKLQEAKAFHSDLDHWILIAPRAKVANTLRSMLERWEDEHEFPFRVQLWTKDNGIGELFGLEPALFDFWCGDYETSEHPLKWNQQRRDKVLQHWRSRLEPPLKLGAAWTRYLTDHSHLRIYSDEPQDSLDRLRDSYVEMQGLDEAGAVLPESLHESVVRWLLTKTRILLLLGDFGDGKTIFTYFLTVRLLEKFKRNPREAFLPIRFSLRDFTRTGVHDARDFLRRRLEEFGAGIDNWRKISAKHTILVILDGVDEMSKSINRVKVNELISRLVECCNVEFKEHRIVLTCRSTFFDGLVDRTYLMDRLDNPHIIRLKSLDRWDVIDKLESLANSPDQKTRLDSIRLMHDPVGLATKPLFLKMISETVWDSKVVLADEVALYDEYVAKCLRRKCDLLEHDDIRVKPKDLIERVCQVLEDVALDIHVNLREYALLKPQGNDKKKTPYAEMLWKATQSKENDDDAMSRIGVRSLLRKVDLKDNESEHWPVDFCHRSIREYFVARKLESVIRDSVSRARELLAGSDLSREVMRFLVCLMKRGERSGDYHAALRTLALQSKADSQTPTLTLDQKARLGRNAVMLLYLSEGHLEEDDWSGLLLDGIDLSKADLRGKCFANASLRNARMDSVNFCDADFSGADLSGVRFEETGVVRSLAVFEQGDAFAASYDDGTIRRWKLGGLSDAESTVCFQPVGLSGQRSEVAGIPGTGLCVLCGEALILADYHKGRHKAVSHFLLPNTTSLKLRKDSVLIVKRETIDSFSATFYVLEGQEVLLANTKEVGSRNLCDALGNKGLVVGEPGGQCTILSYGKNGDEITLEEVDGCTAVASISNRNGSDEEFVIACAEQQGFITVFRCKFSQDSKITIEKHFRQKVHEGSVGALTFVSDHALLSGGADKRICRIEFGDHEVSIADTYQLALSCTGMKIEGIKGEAEYQILKSLIRRA